ncbi:MAG: pyridoxine 4-dehydrogenase [Solirubrobacteraceae bacterium]|nr:pyridoxine 4-dehydrogenase [Solirubrobacteraceae bacterium]
MQLAGPGVFGPPSDPEAARAVLRRAVELGVDHIDTSQYYGPDVVNELIREALHPYPDNLKLVSKVGGRRDDQGAWLPALSPAELRQGVDDNLRTLGVEQLALVNLRIMEEGGVPTPEQLGTMEDLRQEGKIAAIGVSNVSVAGLDAARELIDVGQVQNAYSIVNREHEDLLERCRDLNIPFVPFFPLGSAFTGGPKALAADPAIASVAAKHGASPSQIALAWLLGTYDRTLLIPGTSSVAHLEENLAAGDHTLDAEDLQTLEGVKLLGDPLSAHE